MYIHKEKPYQVTSVSSFKLYDLYVSRRTPDITKKPLPADNLIKSKKNILRRTTSCSTRHGNDFEIESKYRHETVVLLIAHILSLQDVVLKCMFFLY